MNGEDIKTEVAGEGAQNAASDNNADGGGNKPEKLFTQAEFELQMKERLERERKKSETAALKAKSDAEAEAAKKNGEWQTLAEKREARVKELEALQPQLEALTSERDDLNGTIGKLLEAERKDLPASVLELLDFLTPAKQLDWLTKNKPTLSPDKQVKRVPGTPVADETKKMSEAEDLRHRQEAYRQMRQMA